MNARSKIAFAVGALLTTWLLWCLLPPIELKSHRDVAALNTKNLVAIQHAIVRYQEAHDGNRPARLEDALPGHLSREVAFRREIGHDGIPWQYFPHGSNGLIVVAPEAIHGRILVLDEHGQVGSRGVSQ